MGLAPQGLGVKLWGWCHKGCGSSCVLSATRAGGEAVGLVPQGLGVKLWGWCHKG